MLNHSKCNLLFKTLKIYSLKIDLKLKIENLKLEWRAVARHN